METENKIKAIELHELMQQEPAPLVVDVRSSDQYEAGRISGSRNIPRAELLEVLLEPPINREIVVYCNMKHPGSSSSEQAAQLLRDRGYTVQVLEGGYPAWRDAGYEVETGYDHVSNLPPA